MDPEAKNQALQLGRISLAAYATAVRPWYQMATHLDIIIQALEMVEAGAIKRLMIFAPPRHGKSETVTRLFPAWFQGKHPEQKVMICCHTANLSSEFGYEIREIIQSPEHKAIFPEHRLKDDSAAKDNWNTTAGGKFFAAGISGGATGRGANCVLGDTLIITSHGRMRIEDLVQLECKPKVLAYCHIQNKEVWRNVIATREVAANRIVEITTTSGRSIKCTDEHRLHVPGAGYVEARNLVPGDALLAFDGNDYLRQLRKSLHQASIRDRQNSKKGTQRSLLRPALFNGSSRGQKLPPMYHLQQTRKHKDERALRRLQRKTSQREREVEGIAKNNHLSPMRKNSSKDSLSSNLLCSRMCRYSSLKANDRHWQSTLQRWQESCEMVRRNASSYSQARQIFLHGVRSARSLYYSWQKTNPNVHDSNPSHKRRHNEQSSPKSRGIMSAVSRYSSQVVRDTISETRTVCGESLKVYDIQVEGTSNFFGADLLLHNCLIIDDPTKSKEEASSPIMRKKVHDFYTSVGRMRLQPGGSIIIVNTRWHEHDLPGWLLDPDAREGGKVDDWKIIDLPAIAEKDSSWRKTGEALWPAFFPLKELLSIKNDVGQWDWTAMYQQKPSAIEGMLVKRSWFNRYHWDPRLASSDRQKMLQIMTKPFRIIQSWDTALCEGQENDYSVCETWMETEDADFLLDIWRQKVITPTLVRAAEELALSWAADAILIEDSTPGKAFVQHLKVIKKKLPIIARQPRGQKLVRLQAVSPYIESGHIWIPQNAPFVMDFLNEICSFPTAAHDDQVDSLSQYLDWSQEQRNIRYKAQQRAAVKYEVNIADV